MNAQIPTLRCYVRLEFLHNLDPKWDGQVAECDVVGVKSVPCRVLGFHVLLRNGVLFWDLPIQSLCTDPKAPRPNWWRCQKWDCFSEHVETNCFERLRGLTATIRPHGKHQVKALYHCTLDWHPGPGLDLTMTRLPEESKTQHLLLGVDGNLYLIPNNRLRWQDKSFTVEPFPEKPTYKTQTHSWSSEYVTGPLPNSDLAFEDSHDPE